MRAGAHDLSDMFRNIIHAQKPLMAGTPRGRFERKMLSMALHKPACPYLVQSVKPIQSQHTSLVTLHLAAANHRLCLHEGVRV